MGRLTFDIPDTTHRRLKIRAAETGATIRDLILGWLQTEFDDSDPAKKSLHALMSDWEERRQTLNLKRGSKSYHDMIHEGHKR